MSPSKRHAPIGLIVKTWNTPDATRHCLDVVAGAQLLPREIAVVDLGEDRVTRAHAIEVADRTGIILHWLPIGHRLAPGAANQRGLQALSTPMIGLLDNDVVVPRHWLEPMTSILRSPGVGLVAPIRPDPFLAYPGRDGSTEGILDELMVRFGGVLDITQAFVGGTSLEEFGLEIQRRNDLPREAVIDFPSFLSSCCLGMNRAAIEAAGGISDSLFSDGYGSEDIDLSWRVLRAGYDVVRTSEVFVLHLRHTSLEANRVDYRTELITANRILYAKWRRELLAWARDRLRRGDSRDDLAQRFIVRELLRNTAFETDLFPAPVR